MNTYVQRLIDFFYRIIVWERNRFVTTENGTLFTFTGIYWNLIWSNKKYFITFFNNTHYFILFLNNNEPIMFIFMCTQLLHNLPTYVTQIIMAMPWNGRPIWFVLSIQIFIELLHGILLCLPLIYSMRL